MMNSEQSSSVPLRKHARYAGIAIMALAIAGFADAAFLAALHFLAAPAPCSLVGDCDTVLTSEYASMAGVPLAVYGMVFYATVFLCAMRYIRSHKNIFARAILVLSGVGSVASAVFIYIQVVLIGAICAYCVGSALISFALVGISVFYIKGE